MKITEQRPNVESSGQLEEQFFSIQDQGMIFDILRNKMYSNPIAAICREISCNARDAHREVGTPDKPVEIYLPNSLEKYFKVKDFGPGISPDRMSNIFIKYTASTKRDDNTQTGGFGLGAKTPFAYSDTFNIVTNYNGTQYNYACIIDETKVGKLMSLHQSPTKEPNGTEILIPVKAVDFKTFADWTEISTRHWEVKPLIKGNQISYPAFNKILEGKNWAIASSSSYNREAKIIVDGIEYPLDLATLKTYADSKLIDSSRGNLYLYFGIGELTLSANREQVFLDKMTKEKISKRLGEVITEIKTNVDAKIDSFPNLWEANIFYRQELNSAFSDLRFLGTLAWKGAVLHNGYISLECSVFSFTKGKYNRKSGTDPNKLTRSNTRSLTFDAKSELYINDLPLKEPTPRHVKKAFELDDKLTSVQVICPSDKITLDFLNKSIHLDKMIPKLLSSITKASARAHTVATSRLLVFKFESATSSFKQVSYSSLDEDTNTKILCMLTKDSYPNSRQVILKNNKIVSLHSIKSLVDKFTNVSLYGVDSSTPADRLEEDLSDFTDVDDFISEKVLDNKSINYTEIKFAINHNYDIDERMLSYETQMRPIIEDPNSFFLKRLDLHNKLKTLNASDTGLLMIYESVNGEISKADLESFAKKNPDYDIKLVNKLYEDKYPLLRHISSYNYQTALKAVIQYINLIDKV